MHRPIVICCSQRFKAELEKFVAFLAKKGFLVFYPDFKFHRKKIIKKPERLRPKLSTRTTSGLVLTHLKKIDKVHGLDGICLIFNPLPGEGQKKSFGYVGDNTLLEIGYASGQNMFVLMLKPSDKDCVMAAIDQTEKKMIFTVQCPKNNALDFEAVWDNWLSFWVNGGRSI